MGHVVDVHVYPGPVLNVFPENTKVGHNMFPCAAADCVIARFMLWTRAELPVWGRCGVSANLSGDTIGK